MRRRDVWLPDGTIESEELLAIDRVPDAARAVVGPIQRPRSRGSKEKDSRLNSLNLRTRCGRSNKLAEYRLLSMGQISTRFVLVCVGPGDEARPGLVKSAVRQRQDVRAKHLRDTGRNRQALTT